MSTATNDLSAALAHNEVLRRALERVEAICLTVDGEPMRRDDCSFGEGSVRGDVTDVAAAALAETGGGDVRGALDALLREVADNAIVFRLETHSPGHPKYTHSKAIDMAVDDANRLGGEVHDFFSALSTPDHAPLDLPVSRVGAAASVAECARLPSAHDPCGGQIPDSPAPSSDTPCRFMARVDLAAPCTPAHAFCWWANRGGPGMFPDADDMAAYAQHCIEVLAKGDGS